MSARMHYATDLFRSSISTNQRIVSEEEVPVVPSGSEGSEIRDASGKRGLVRQSSFGWRTNQVNKFCGARLRKPQRVASITKDQERDRWCQTLSSYDRLLYNCLREHRFGAAILDEAKHDFVSNVSDMVVCHCDQVPMWLRIGSMRQLVSATELSGAKSRGDGARSSQQCYSVLDDGISQVRQACNSEADRFRVTLELSQYVHNVSRPGIMPVVEHGRPVLVVYGVHCRLSNISPEGTWVQGESFAAAGKPVERKRGAPAGRCMQTWRDLRSSVRYEHF